MTLQESDKNSDNNNDNNNNNDNRTCKEGTVRMESGNISRGNTDTDGGFGVRPLYT